jgi:hypothetical protein
MAKAPFRTTICHGQHVGTALESKEATAMRNSMAERRFRNSPKPNQGADLRKSIARKSMSTVPSPQRSVDIRKPLAEKQFWNQTEPNEGVDMRKSNARNHMSTVGFFYQEGVVCSRRPGSRAPLCFRRLAYGGNGAGSLG